MISEIKTESDFFTKVFKEWLMLQGHREIMRVEHARLPDVQAVDVAKEKIIQYELKIGKFELERRLSNYPALECTFKVNYRAGQRLYAERVNQYAPHTVQLVIYDKKKREAVVCVPVQNGEKSKVLKQIKNI